MIYVLLADGFEEIEALAPVDILRRAGLPVKTVGITGKAVCGSHGIPVTADVTPDEATEKLDLLVLPGGMPGAANLDQSPAAEALLRRAIDEGAHIGAICAAPFILGKRGLLQGKRAVCYPGFEGELCGATLCGEGVHVVTDGKITTAIGMGAASEFGLALLQALGHEDKATKIADAAFLR